MGFLKILLLVGVVIGFTAGCDSGQSASSGNSTVSAGKRAGAREPARCADAATHPVETPDVQRVKWSWEIDAPSALPVCQKEVAANPDDPILRIHLGRVQHVSGDLLSAAKNFKFASDKGLPLGDLLLANLALISGNAEDLEYLKLFLRRARDGFERQVSRSEPAGSMGLVFVESIDIQAPPEAQLQPRIRGYAGNAAEAGYGDSIVFYALTIRNAELGTDGKKPPTRMSSFSQGMLEYAANVGHSEAALQAAVDLLRPAEAIYARGGRERDYYVSSTLAHARRYLSISAKSGMTPDRVAPLQKMVDDIQARYDSRGAAALLAVVGTLAVIAQKEAENGTYEKWLKESRASTSSGVGPNPLHCGALASQAYGGSSGATTAYVLGGC